MGTAAHRARFRHRTRYDGWVFVIQEQLCSSRKLVRIRTLRLPRSDNTNQQFAFTLGFRLQQRATFMSTQPSIASRIERIALGSDRAAKIMAVRASIARVAEIDPAWRETAVV